MAFVWLGTLHRAADLLSDTHDILSQRVQRTIQPPWICDDVESRIWLSSLSDADLRACEQTGLAAFLREQSGIGRDAPQRLMDISERAFYIQKSIPQMDLGRDTFRANTRRVKPAKLQQIQAVTSAIENMIMSEKGSLQSIRRILDVGGGHGHLSSHLAASLAAREGIRERLPVVCLDRDISLLKTAEGLSDCRGTSGLVSFFQADAVADNVDAARRGDLIVGLHACGALGDQIISAAVDRHAAAVVLVSCCLQKLGKIPDEVREPLCCSLRSEERNSRGLYVDGKILGLTNRVRGFHADADLVGRETRIALSMLLASRGHETEPPKDIHGLSRHRVRRGLATVAREALEMRGDYYPVSEMEIDMHSTAAKLHYRESTTG
jgi:protein-L-isoaspartate O-methyltransferase